MPTGYAGEGKTFSKKLGKWLKKEKTKAFDYDTMPNKDSAALIVSFFRFYPDYFADIIRDENAPYKLELPQRIMLRVMARYRNVYITGVRGITKTFSLVLQKLISGVLYPSIVIKYIAPNQKKAAALATQAYHKIESCYPALTDLYQLRNDRSDMFRVSTQYNTEFSMYSTRGDNITEVCGEECGEEGETAFPIEDFITNIIPAVRTTRMVNQHKDEIYGDCKHLYIGNACSKSNLAYTKLRHDILKGMCYPEKGKKYENYVLDMPWQVAVLCNIQQISYFKDLRGTLSPEAWQRECEALYTGTGENPMITDEVLSASRRLQTAELSHCGDDNCIYVVAHDDAVVDRRQNAKCADVVIKLTRYTTNIKRDKYRKQIVFAEKYPPPPTVFLRAQRIKQTWRKFCKVGGNITYLVVDARNAGADVVSELMKPLEDGLPPLSCIDGYNQALEQRNAIRCLVPITASIGGRNDESTMIDYARGEFEQGNVELLTADIRYGVENYKVRHGIKDNNADGRISLPYRETNQLCQQIANLKVEASGTGYKEKRISPSIPRDLWSALKYGLRVCREEEKKLSLENYTEKSSLAEAVEKFMQNGRQTTAGVNHHANNIRAQLLSLRRR